MPTIGFQLNYLTSVKSFTTMCKHKFLMLRVRLPSVEKGPLPILSPCAIMFLNTMLVTDRSNPLLIVMCPVRVPQVKPCLECHMLSQGAPSETLSECHVPLKESQHMMATSVTPQALMHSVSLLE